MRDGQTEMLSDVRSLCLKISQVSPELTMAPCLSPSIQFPCRSVSHPLVTAVPWAACMWFASTNTHVGIF